ncbi:hypothetical protein LCGC14_0880690 [marine sediment metagenome]|uniref:Uncharacterized protein n=1 Tax=marine sediment metagenome TaxID=412755 RepID=A0A0F9PMN0_9ZZZZ|nr:hypothetical protein [Candidatus Scalindua sp.]
MAINRRLVRSCCGRKNFFFETEKPIRKFQLPILERAGYTAPKNFYVAGIFYVRGHDVIATSSYGTTRISVHCHGADCENKLNEFEKVLEEAINTDKHPDSK